MSPRRSPLWAEEGRAVRQRVVFMRLTQTEHDQLSEAARELRVSLPLFYELAAWGGNRFVLVRLKLVHQNIKFYRRVLVNTHTNLGQIATCAQGDQLTRIQQAQANVEERIAVVDEMLSCFTVRGIFKGWGSGVTKNGGSEPTKPRRRSPKVVQSGSPMTHSVNQRVTQGEPGE